MDDITFVRSHWWLVSEGFSLSTANSDVQKLPPLCTIVLQIPSLMPLKMRKVQPPTSPETALPHRLPRQTASCPRAAAARPCPATHRFQPLPAGSS